MSLNLQQREKLTTLVLSMSSASYLYGWYAAKHDVQVQSAKEREQKVWAEVKAFLSEMEEAHEDS